jgi:putative heme iron utilization protein
VSASDAARLVVAQRWAALATVSQGRAAGSMVAYAAEPGLRGLLMFLSMLGSHTRDLIADPRSSLVVTAPDPGEGDPQTLPRASLEGAAHEVARHDPEFAGAWACYVGRFPDAAPRIALTDFLLMRFVPERARYVGGFARAATYTAEELSAGLAG